MKTIRKKSIKTTKKLPETIYNQLSILTPEEIKYLLVNFKSKECYRVIEEQKKQVEEMQSQLEEIKKGRVVYPGYDELLADRIVATTKIIETNINNTKIIHSIENKLKQFEGIV